MTACRVVVTVRVRNAEAFPRFLVFLSWGSFMCSWRTMAFPLLNFSPSRRGLRGEEGEALVLYLLLRSNKTQRWEFKKTHFYLGISIECTRFS